MQWGGWHGRDSDATLTVRHHRMTASGRLKYCLRDVRYLCTFVLTSRTGTFLIVNNDDKFVV